MFNAIIELRRLRKFQISIFEQLFDYIVDEFLNFLNSKKNVIIKQALIFASELFSSYSSNYLYQNWILKITPKVLTKIVSETCLIKQEAIKCIQNLINNMIYLETSKILLHEIMNKNINISNIAFDALINYLNNLDLVTLENYVEWDFYNSTIINLYLLKKEFYIKKAYKLFEYIELRFNSLDVLTLNMKEEQRSGMTYIFEQRVKVQQDKAKTAENVQRRQSVAQRVYEYQSNKENKGAYNNVNISQ